MRRVTLTSLYIYEDSYRASYGLLWAPYGLGLLTEADLYKVSASEIKLLTEADIYKLSASVNQFCEVVFYNLFG